MCVHLCNKQSRKAWHLSFIHLHKINSCQIKSNIANYLDVIWPRCVGVMYPENLIFGKEMDKFYKKAEKKGLCRKLM